MLEIITSLNDQYDIVVKQIIDTDIDEAYFFAKEPCLVALVDKDMLMKFVQPLLSDNQLLYLQLEKYIYNIQYLIHKHKIYLYMTLSGIKHFIETGCVSEFPEYYLKLIDMDTRKKLMNRLIGQIKDGSVFILSDRYEKIDLHFHMFTTPSFGYILLSDSKEQLKYFNLKEQSIIGQLFDFAKLLQVENLYEDIIIDKEEACQSIQNMINNYIK